MKSLFVIAALAFTTAANASCLNLGENFWDTMANHRKEEKAHNWKPLTIVAGTVTGQFSSGYASFRVATLLQGTVTQDIVINMNGGYSLPQSALPTGTSWILAMDRDPETGYYSVSVCGVYSLKTAVIR